MHRLFEGSAYLRAVFIEKLDVTKICYSIIIFHIKLRELKSFDFYFIGEAELFWGKCLFKFIWRALIPGLGV